MTVIKNDRPPYIFRIQPPGYLRIAGSLLLAVFVAASAFIVYEIGLSWIPQDPFPGLLLMTTITAGVLFALWMLLPPQSTRARFEITSEFIRFAPNFIARIIGEKSEEAAISSQSAEVLICHRFEPQRPDGYCVIVRATGGSEFQLASHSPHTRIDLNPSDINNLSEAINAFTGLPVRVVTRQKSLAGTVEEAPWTHIPTSRQPVRVVVLATIALPFAGGILMGLLSPNFVIVLVVGLVLWIFQTLWIYVSSRTNSGPRTYPLLQVLATLTTFSSLYAVCFVVTAHIHGRL